MKPVPKPSLEKVYEFYGLRIIGGDRGGWRKAACPLPDHEDANPSASVNEDECKWSCHACGEGGDAIDIIMRRDRVGWAAARTIAESFLDGSSDQVRDTSGSGRHIPGRQRRDTRGGSYVPPWLRG